MPLRWRSRHRRGSSLEVDPDAVDLSSEEHAWWADRDDVNGVPQGGQGSSRRTGAHVREPIGGKARRETFADYFTAASLYRSTPAAERPTPVDDPYAILGLPETSSWEEITAMHRRLAKEHHPDRLSDATDEQRATSEAYMRELNIAYMELRRRRGR